MFLEIPVTDVYENKDKTILINTNQIEFIEEHPYLEDCSRIAFCGEPDYLNVKVKYSNIRDFLIEGVFE